MDNSEGPSESLIAGLKNDLEITNDALREANDENIELRGANTRLQGQLTQQSPTPTLFTFFSLVHTLPQNDVIIYPIPRDLVSRARLVEILRRAADGLLKGMK